MDTDNKLFELIRTVWSKQEKQKLRGLNDYNLLSTVLSPHDEVRLHSRMIASLLDPVGKHYQGTLFLESFMHVLGLDDFGLNLENTKVYLEYKDIDIYLTDGIKHILVENKIWAGDQPCQIIKYINIIKNENQIESTIGSHLWEGDKLETLENMIVIYLTPNDKLCSDQHSIKNNKISFSGEKSELEKCQKKMRKSGTIDFDMQNYQVEFLKIEYKKEIMDWLIKIKNEVQNITNLNISIGQYIEIVQIINNNYKGKIMTLSEELLKDETMLLEALKLDKEMKGIKGNILYTFFKNANSSNKCNFKEIVEKGWANRI